MVLLVLSLAGCSREPRAPLAAYQPVGLAAPISPADAVRPFRLGALDVLRIDVLQEPELTTDRLAVDPDGFIQVPMAGRVHVADKTVDEVSRELTTRLSRFIRRPQVAVNVVEVLSRQVTVEGEVRQAGSFPTPQAITLTRAVALARGTTEDARLDEVFIFRTIDGRDYAARFDLSAVRKGEVADPVVQPGDVVAVGVSESRRRFRDALAVLPIVFGLFYAIIN